MAPTLTFLGPFVSRFWSIVACHYRDGLRDPWFPGRIVHCNKMIHPIHLTCNCGLMLGLFGWNKKGVIFPLWVSGTWQWAFLTANGLQKVNREHYLPYEVLTSDCDFFVSETNPLPTFDSSSGKLCGWEQVPAQVTVYCLMLLPVFSSFAPKCRSRLSEPDWGFCSS